MVLADAARHGGTQAEAWWTHTMLHDRHRLRFTPHTGAWGPPSRPQHCLERPKPRRDIVSGVNRGGLEHPGGRVGSLV